MSNVYDEIYDKRPVLKIASRLMNLKTARDLARQAQEQNYNVHFQNGGMRDDVIILKNEKEESFTLQKAARLFIDWPD